MKSIFSDKTSVIFDESTRHGKPTKHNPNISPHEQYNYYGAETNEQNKNWLLEKKYEKDSSGYWCFSSQYFLKFVTSKFPNSSIETHLGLNPKSGGNLRDVNYLLKSILKNKDEEYVNISSLMVSDKSNQNIISAKNPIMTKEKWTEFRNLQNMLAKLIVEDIYEKSFKN